MCLSESCGADQRKMFLVRLCYRNLIQGIQSMTYVYGSSHMRTVDYVTPACTQMPELVVRGRPKYFAPGETMLWGPREVAA